MSLNDQQFPKKIAVAISGQGRTLANLLKKQSAYFSYEVAGVIASSPDCAGISLAKEHKLPTFVEEFPLTPDSALQSKLYSWLNEQKIHVVVLGGFIRPFPLIPEWKNRILNIHPSLLPKHGGKGFYGKKVHEAVLAAKESQTGASVHFVNEEYDRGQVLAQITLPVHEDDDPESLGSRVFAAECSLYPQAIDLFLKGRLPLRGAQVKRISYDAPDED